MKTLATLIMMSVCGTTLVACTQTPAETVDATADVQTVVQADTATKAVVQTVYDGFAAGDMEMVTSVMSNGIVWNEAQGNPYADKNPYIGPDAILSGLFSRLGGEWEYFTAEPNEFIIDGTRVAVIGQYEARHKTTDRTLDAPFVHVWTVQGSEIIAFQQYTDTAAHVVAMGG